MAVRRPSEALAPVSSAGPLRIWALQHVSTCVAALGRLSQQPFANLMTVLVIAVTLALPAAMHLVIKNAQSISGKLENALDFSVYLTTGTSLADAENLASIIEQRADVESVTFVSAERALEEFKEHSGFGSALEHLEGNPLPHTLVVRPSGANTALRAPTAIGVSRRCKRCHCSKRSPGRSP